MIELPRIGYGAYRVSIKSEEHYESLVHAIQNNCGLVDTSSNYTDGDSEKLIGKALKSCEKKPIIVTKFGYAQGSNLERINELKLNDVVTIDEDLKHCIHPEFIDNQIELSLSNLGLEKIDIYLMHNPEYYFYEESASQDKYYARIEKALLHLESLMIKGKITEYGISSNNFTMSPEDPKVTSLDKVLEIVKKHNLKGFTTIQFPMNLIELGALEKYEQFNLIEKCKFNNIKTMINRPLNAFTSKGLLRLASYDGLIDYPTDEFATTKFENCKKLIETKWLEQENEGEDFNDIPIFKQFSELWDKLPSPDAVDQVFFGHFFPFLAATWGAGGLSPQESEPFYELYDISQLLSRKQMSLRAKSFYDSAISSGLLEDSGKPLSVASVEKYLDYGVDCVLIGLKNNNYVDQFKHLF